MTTETATLLYDVAEVAKCTNRDALIATIAINANEIAYRADNQSQFNILRAEVRDNREFLGLDGELRRTGQGIENAIRSIEHTLMMIRDKQAIIAACVDRLKAI